MFIYRNITAREKTVNLIKEHSKDNKNIRLNTDIHYSIQKLNNKDALISWMNPNGQSLLDTEPYAHIHEAVHLYIASYVSPISEVWLQRACVSTLTYFLVSIIKSRVTKEWLDSGGDINETKFFGEVRKQYRVVVVS